MLSSPPPVPGASCAVFHPSDVSLRSFYWCVADGETEAEHVTFWRPLTVSTVSNTPSTNYVCQKHLGFPQGDSGGSHRASPYLELGPTHFCFLTAFLGCSRKHPRWAVRPQRSDCLAPVDSVWGLELHAGGRRSVGNDRGRKQCFVSRALRPPRAPSFLSPSYLSSLYISCTLRTLTGAPLASGALARR